MLRKVSLVVAVALLCICGSARAALIDPDGGDTQFTPIDLGDINVSFDDQNLYIQYVHDHDGWTGIQVGVALVTMAGFGGTTDPWGHQIAFGGLCPLPNFIAYMNIDSQWNEWCIWTGTDWNRIPNILNWSVLGPVDVLAVPWTLLGVDCHSQIQILMEMWITQDSPTKGPLDLSYNDSLQLSTPSGTIWDITTPVVISCYHCIYAYGPSGTEQTTWSGVKNLWR